MSIPCEVLIIGAGPAGLSAAIYTGRARLDTIIVERGIPGGQVMKTDFIENYPGFPDRITPFQLMDGFKKQAEKFGAKFQTDDVREIRKSGENWEIKGLNKSFAAKAVIVATGSIYRKLGIKGEAELTGKGVSYCATCDGAFFTDKDVGVVGGGDNALTESLFLTKFCRTVKHFHRRDKFRGAKILQERIFENPKIEVIWDTVVEKINGQDKVEGVLVRNVKTNESTDVALNGFFISIGADPNTGFLKGVVELDEWNKVKVKKNMASSEDGLFAAGDVTDASPEQVATAVGTGVIAALGVTEYLDS